MSQELFFDAMEYIDDDMIEAVDALRSQKSTKANRVWMRYASLAACAVIAVAGVFAAGRYMLSDSAETEDGADNEMASIGTETGASPNETMASDGDSGYAENGEHTYPDTIDCSTIDLSGVKSVRLSCGYTGEKILLTDPQSIKEITDCVQKIRCNSPESSRGYYGWSFGITLYDVESPGDDTTPIWYGGMFWGKMYSRYPYETVNDHTYPALYTMVGITTEEIDSVCEKYFPSLENFD